jgi:hypothetical protein
VTQDKTGFLPATIHNQLEQKSPLKHLMKNSKLDDERAGCPRPNTLEKLTTQTSADPSRVDEG